MTQHDHGSEPTGGLTNVGPIQGSALAEVIRTRLDAAGITATLQSDPETTGGVEMGLMGNVNVMVPAGDAERARGIIAEADRESEIPMQGQEHDRG